MPNCSLGSENLIIISAFKSLVAKEMDLIKITLGQESAEKPQRRAGSRGTKRGCYRKSPSDSEDRDLRVISAD